MKPSYSILVVSQPYAASVMDDFVIAGNNQIVKCNIPAIVSGSVFVTSWVINETHIDRTDHFGRYFFFKNCNSSGIAGSAHRVIRIRVPLL